MVDNKPSSSHPVLACSNIVKQYDDGSGQVSVLKNLSFEVHAGERLAIIGASGSGKSSLLHILGGLDRPTSGEVVVADKTLSTLSQSQQAQLRNQKLGFVYQFHHLLAEFTALENVAMPLRISNISTSEANERAKEALEQVGLQHRLDHRPNALSGGERQRVAIARAIVNKPAVLLADEPTGNLDASTGEQVYQLLLDIQASTNMAFVIVTHDLSLAHKMDRCLTLVNGQLSAQ